LSGPELWLSPWSERTLPRPIRLNLAAESDLSSLPAMLFLVPGGVITIHIIRSDEIRGGGRIDSIA
jgi:hypothetical protein